MAKQYPPSPEARRALSRYLVCDLQVDPMTSLIPCLLGVVQFTESNGMLTLSNGKDNVGELTFPESLADAAVPSELPEAAFCRLVLHCAALVVPLPVVAAFVHSEHLARPGSRLCSSMWHWLAYMHAAPQPVCTAFRCLRPDLLQAVQRLYGGWLARCRSPRQISNVLEQLVTSQWRVQSDTAACMVLTDLVRTAQVAAVPSKTLTDADVIVDERAGLLISERDKCFLALALIGGQHRQAAMQGIKAFKNAASDWPKAFEELSKGSHPLDELELE